MKIWIVWSYGGEYEDKYCVINKAFSSSNSAKKYLKKMKENPGKQGAKLGEVFPDYGDFDKYSLERVEVED